MAVLGLLNEGPMHPYEVSFRMKECHLDEHIKLNFGSLYHAFDQLQRQGLVEPMETAREGRRPERTVYRLTDSGHDAFLDRLRQLILEPEPAYTGFEAGLAFVSHLEKEEAVGLLRARADALDRQFAVHEAVLDHLMGPGGLSRLSLIEVEMVQDVRRHQAQWCRRIAGEIEAGSIEWVAGFQQGQPGLRVLPETEEISNT